METQTPKLILVPTDFSAPAAHALRYAAALGARFEAHLLVIYADLFVPHVDFTISAAGVFDIGREDLIEAAREQLQTFAETNISTAMPYDVRVMAGTPVDTILAQVRESGANLIVMGTHGRTGLRRLLFGSVTEAVMRVAPVPVIAVHEITPEAAPMQVIAGSRSTAEGRAAVEYAGLLADVDTGRFVETSETDLLDAARRERVDLIALGISGEHRDGEGVVQHSNCAVLTVNALAAHALHARELAPSGVRS
jgi:nucleotide-binding universal stress UspA family protein